MVEMKFKETSSLDMDPTTLTFFSLVLGWTGSFMMDVTTQFVVQIQPEELRA